MHRIRPSTRKRTSSIGRQYLLYHQPELTGGMGCKHDVEIADLDVSRDIFIVTNPYPHRLSLRRWQSLLLPNKGLECQEMATMREVFI